MNEFAILERAKLKLKIWDFPESNRGNERTKCRSESIDLRMGSVKWGNVKKWWVFSDNETTIHLPSFRFIDGNL